MMGALAAAAFLAGMVAAANLSAAYAAGAAAAIGTALLQFHDRGRPPRPLMLAAIAGLALLGVLRYETGLPHPEESGLARLNEAGDVTIRGVVVTPPEERGATTQLRVEARQLVGEAGTATALDGLLLVTLPPYPEYRYGDVVELRGGLETPHAFDGFDYREYLARQGIGSVTSFAEVRRIGGGEGDPLRSRVFELRSYLADVLARELPEPEAGLAQGMTLGVRRAIAPELRDDLNATGTSHLVVISGQNVVVLAALVTAASAWLIGRRRAGIVALAVVAGYTLLAGAEPPVVRGAIMGAAATVAALHGRRASAPVTLVLAAALMALHRPAILNDVSFQLSLAATGGLVAFAGPLAGWARALLRVPDAPPGPAHAIIEALSVTAAATIATLPIVALNFGRIAIVTLPANLALAPLFPVILALATLTSVLGGLWAPLGAFLAPATWLSLHAMVTLVRWFTGLPYASAEVDGIRTWHAVAAYAGLGALAWWLRGPVAPRERPPGAATQKRWAAAFTGRAAGATALGAVAALAAMASWQAGASDAAGRFEVRFLDAGQGDAALIRSPAGRTILIDGSGDGQRLAQELGESMPPRDRSIDLVVVTHADADHATGLVEALRRFDVGELLVPERGEGSPFLALIAQARESGVPVRIGRAGQRFEFDGASIEVLSPTHGLRGNENDAGLVLRLRYNAADVLFTADIEAAGEAELVAAEPAADVLKVAHHGSQTSSSAALLEAVDAQAAVISVGEGNRYRHPHDDVVARLTAAIPHVLRTDRDGTVILTTDGERIWLRTER